MDDALVERCAQAAWEAGRCSPPWGSRSQLEANRETYRRSARVVLEEAMRAGFLHPDSAARLRRAELLRREGERAEVAWHEALPGDEEVQAGHLLAQVIEEHEQALAAITEADLGITTTTEEPT